MDNNVNNMDKVYRISLINNEEIFVYSNEDKIKRVMDNLHRYKYFEVADIDDNMHYIPTNYIVHVHE